MSREKLLELADRIDAAMGPDKGLIYEGANGGERRYDPLTGEAYFTWPSAARLTVHGERADLLLDILNGDGKLIVDALRARASLTGEKEDRGCEYCRNDGPLTEVCGTPRCPRCDAEYPEGDEA